MFRKSLISYTHIRNPVNWEWNAGVRTFDFQHRQITSTSSSSSSKAKGCGQSQNQGSELNLNGRTKREE